MVKILTSFEEVEKNGPPDKEVLLKIKLFLKVSRLIVENAKSALEISKSEKESEFFSMYHFYYVRIYTFSEKVQSKLFAISNNFKSM